MANIRIIEDKEVFWATATEYTIEIDGETVVCKIEENSNDTKFFEYTEGTGWEESDIDNGIMAVIYAAWSDGDFAGNRIG